MSERKIVKNSAFVKNEEEFSEIIDLGFVKNEFNQYSYTYKKNFENRIIYIDQEIDQMMALDCTRLIMYYNKEDANLSIEERKPIKLFVYTPGGDVMAMWHIVDICRLSKTPVYTYNLGCSFSAGFVILLAGHKRYGLKNSTVLCHKGSIYNMSGNIDDVRAGLSTGIDSVKKIFNFITERTKITKKMLDKKTPSDWYITGDEQLELGIIDEMVEDIDCML